MNGTEKIYRIPINQEDQRNDREIGQSETRNLTIKQWLLRNELH